MSRANVVGRYQTLHGKYDSNKQSELDKPETEKMKMLNWKGG